MKGAGRTLNSQPAQQQQSSPSICNKQRKSQSSSRQRSQGNVAPPTGVSQKPSDKHVISPKDPSPGLHAPNNRSMKSKRSSPVSLPSAKKSKEIMRMNRSETSIRDDVPLQSKSSKVKARPSSCSAAIDSFSSVARVESPQQNDRSSTPDLAIVESETETKSSTAMTSKIIVRDSPLRRTPKSSGRLSLISDCTLSAHAVNSSLTEVNKSAGRDIALKTSVSPSLNRPNLSPCKRNNLGWSPQLQQTQARFSLPKFLDDDTVLPVASVASNSSRSVASPIETPVSVSVPPRDTVSVDDPPRSPVVANSKSDRSATSSLRKSSRLTLSSLEDGASHLPSASEQCSSDEPSSVSWMVRQSHFIDHESRFAKRRKAQERASRHGNVDLFDLVFTSEDFVSAEDEAGKSCSPAQPSANGGPSDALTELLRPSTPCLDQTASPDVWAEMSKGEGPSSKNVAALPVMNKKDTPRRGKGSRRRPQSLAVAAALESCRRVLLAGAVGQENNNRVSRERGRSSRVSQLASPSTPRPSSPSTPRPPSAKTGTPVTLRRSSRRSVRTPRP